jgi:hypothetical protein
MLINQIEAGPLNETLLDTLHEKLDKEIAHLAQQYQDELTTGIRAPSTSSSSEGFQSLPQIFGDYEPKLYRRTLPILSSSNYQMQYQLDPMSFIDISTQINPLNLPKQHLPTSPSIVKAAENGDSDLLATLLQTEDIHSAGSDGTTALHAALGYSCKPEQARTIVTMLLAANPNVNAKNIIDKTPLHYVAGNGSITEDDALYIIEQLLAAGAKPDAKNISGQTPADCAVTPARAERIKSAL